LHIPGRFKVETIPERRKLACHGRGQDVKVIKQK